MSLEIYISALDWLDKGYHVLPIQPGTKKQCAGFGLHQQHITNMQQAAHWFNNFSKFNLAVIAPEDKCIIDFDDWSVYLMWLRAVKQKDQRLALTYTEMTPHDGVHVFLAGATPNNLQLVEHVEIKRVVLVAPSILDKGSLPYEVMIEGEIYSGSLEAALFPLSKIPPSLAPVHRTANTATAQVSRAARADQSPPKNLPISTARAGNKLDLIKSKFSILDLVRKHFPKTTLHGRGRYITACCPFHTEKESSFWIDTEKNLFGCHACKTHGDVINFFALVHNIENSKAIEEMSQTL